MTKGRTVGVLCVFRDSENATRYCFWSGGGGGSKELMGPRKLGKSQKDVKRTENRKCNQFPRIWVGVAPALTSPRAGVSTPPPTFESLACLLLVVVIPNCLSIRIAGGLGKLSTGFSAVGRSAPTTRFLGTLDCFGHSPVILSLQLEMSLFLKHLVVMMSTFRNFSMQERQEHPPSFTLVAPCLVLAIRHCGRPAHGMGRLVPCSDRRP